MSGETLAERGYFLRGVLGISGRVMVRPLRVIFLRLREDEEGREVGEGEMVAMISAGWSVGLSAAMPM